jgi:putative ABC transport system substrate-binding protein
MVLRTLIAAISLFLAALGAQAQPAGGAYRVGVLAQDLQPGLLETFSDELHRLGYVEGRDLVIEVRNAEGHNDRLAGFAQELLRRKVAVILAVNTPAAQAAKKATRSVPIVIVRVADPVKSGLVPSLARPGGNVTGLSFMPDVLGPKGIQLLRETLPRITRVAALYRADNAGARIIVDETERQGERLGLQFLSLPVRDPSEFQAAFAAAARARCEALFVMDDGAITKQRGRILALAQSEALPVVSIYKDFAEAGGLIAYGPDLTVVYRRAAHYVNRILRGERPSDMPVEQPTEFELVVNLKAARALGITVPPSVLIRANDIIN